MRILKSEIYFPIIIGIHLLLWIVDLSMFDGTIALVDGEDETKRVIGEVMSSWVITVFGFNLLMTTRLPIVERIFGGLDKMYVIHRRSGVIAAVLLLLHFGIVPRHPEFTIGKPMGFYAMGIILIGIALAAAPLMKRKIPYHKWLGIHRLMGPAYVLGVAHALFVPTLISKLPLVRTYVLIMAGLGIFSWLYRSVFFRLFQRPHQYTVTGVRHHGRAIVEIRMKAENHLLRYGAGQFAFFSFDDLSPKESHPFTIASNPNEDELRIAVKVAGDFTSELVEQIQTGARVRAIGPYGHLTQDHTRTSGQIWIAGGIGITPFLSMAASARSDDSDVALYWSVRNDSEAHFDEELEHLVSGSTLKYQLWKSDEQGYLDLEALGGAEAVKGKDIFICGPTQLRDSLIRQLRSSGVAMRNIHTEEFAFR